MTSRAPKRLAHFEEDRDPLKRLKQDGPVTSREDRGSAGDRSRDKSYSRRSRSRSPGKDRRNGDKDTRKNDAERLRDIRRGDGDKRRDTKRYSPPRGPRRERSPRRDRSPNRPDRAKDRSREGPPHEKDRSDRRRPPSPVKISEKAGTAHLHSMALAATNGIDGKMDVDEAPNLEEELEAQMKKVMGFGKFRSTKNTKVPGNDKLYGVRKEKKTEYRQYMNRVGGFNRPLSPSHT